jgi:hypothetical protein
MAKSYTILAARQVADIGGLAIHRAKERYT